MLTSRIGGVMKVRRRRRMRRTTPCATLILVLLAAGCAAPRPAPQGQHAGSFSPSQLSGLRPGTRCRIDMVVPPTAAAGSYQRYVGTIGEVTNDGIVLADATEESRIEYATSPHRRPPRVKARETIRVPLAGIAAIRVAESAPSPADAASKSAVLDAPPPR
jgi:hypothetical protein